MNATDPIVLTAYLLCLAYCLYKIKESFNDEFLIRLDGDLLKQQITEQNLQDLLEISFKFDKRFEFDKLNKLAISINNKSNDYSIYVDWDCSALTDLDGRSRRVTRLMPGTTLDLFQNQVFSTVTPNTTLKENITAEDLLERTEDKLPVEVKKPLLDPDKLKKNVQFMKHEAELEFFLGLAMRLVGNNRPPGGDRVYVRCRFVLKKLPWAAGLPWNPKS